jgi:hypothetical protein
MLNDSVFNRILRRDIEKHPWYLGYRDLEMKEKPFLSIH